MPATKIETGIHIELKRLRLTANARKHRPEKTASLAKSIKEGGVQLQDIVVCPQDEVAGQASAFFDVLAGGGRKEAEESLGWEKGRCTIMYGLSPYEKLKITLDENEERQATGPLDDARLYKAMLEAEKGMTQGKLSQKLGMEQGTLSQYLSLIKLDPNVQEIIDRSINLGFAHILQICRLQTPEEQIELAKKADQEGWTVKELKAAVDKRLNNDASPVAVRSPQRPSAPPSPDGRGAGGEATTPDPLSEVWSEAKKDVFMRRCGDWGTAYGARGQLTIPPSEITPVAKGWLFWVEEESQTPRKILAQWFGLLAERLGYDPSKKEPVNGPEVTLVPVNQWKADKAIERAKEIDQESLGIAQKLADLWKPKNPEEAKEMLAQGFEPWLPNSPEEWAEAEKWAKEGVGTFLGVILDSDSYWARKSQALTWQDLGVTDPIAGCHQVIEALRAGLEIPKGQEALSQ